MGTLLLQTLLASFVAGFFICWLSFQIKKGGLRALADEIVHRAEIESEERLSKLELSLKERELTKTQALEKREQESLHKYERLRLSLEKREERLEEREHDLKQEWARALRLSQESKDLKLQLELSIEQLKVKQESLLSMSLDEAKKEIKKQLTQELRDLYHEHLENKLEECRKEGMIKYQQLLLEQLSKVDLHSTLDLITSSVPLPGDEMKRRLVGREGKNIRLLERLTGVNFLLDETPGAVVLSTFDPIRREIAKRSVEILIRDGRIHPSRIEEVVRRVQEKWESDLPLKGKEGALKAGVSDLHPELYTLLGKLYFMNTAGQNLWTHSVEVAKIMGALAGELKLDVDLAKKIGLLHDIGKAALSDKEGPHAMLGQALALKYGENESVANGIGAHHDEITPQTFEAALCPLANILSSKRLGARTPSADPFFERLQKLENYAKQLPGVEQVYILLAGKEIRLFVSPQMINELQAQRLAKELACRIEEEMSYRGKVKVCVIRETKAVAFAD